MIRIIHENVKRKLQFVEKITRFVLNIIFSRRLDQQAVAVTPIMKMLVVAETLNGCFMIRSMTNTLRDPEIIPWIAEMMAGNNLLC